MARTWTIEGAGVALAVTEHGDAEAGGRDPIVVVLHDLAADALTWSAAAAALAGAGGVRVLTYDRRGYGASGAPEPYGATTVEEQAEDLVALLDACGAGAVVLLGDGFGALVALDVMKRHGDRVLGAVLASPPLFAFAPDASEALSAQRQALQADVGEGGPAFAVERWLAREGGGATPGDGGPEATAPAAAAAGTSGGGSEGAAPGVDRGSVARSAAAAPAFFADFAGLATWPVTRGELRRLRQPAVVLTPADAAPHVRQAADALATLLPAGRREHGTDAVAAVRSLLGAPGGMASA